MVLGTASSTWLSMSFRTAEEALSEGNGGWETAEDPRLLLMIERAACRCLLWLWRTKRK